jgi:hypothetical protein
MMVALVTFITAGLAEAKDHFVTIGGGYSPTGNQVSLEKNVLFMQNVLASKRPDHPPHDIYFADGNDPDRDVHYRDPDFETNVPLARRMLAEILGETDSMDFTYRNHEIPNETGPAEKETLAARFRQLASELQSGDRLIVYATGHGGEARGGRGGGLRRRGGAGGRGRNPYNTTLYTWGDDRISASEFSDWLSGFRTDVNVVLVMVQCHSGGFAHTIFEQANASQPLALHARCGFFSQVHDRVAAGCTPDVDEADYQEYSSFFLAALAGKTRAGAELTGVDYDKNGQVSFSEAHAYAVIASDTIDIPITTSDAFLRTYSRAEGSTAGTPPVETAPQRRGRGRGRGPQPELNEGNEPANASQPQSNPPPNGGPTGAPARVEGLMSFAGPIARLAEIARPDQRAILEQLPARLGIRPTASVEDVRRRLETAERDIQSANVRLNEATDIYDDAVAVARDDVRRIWPELNSTYTPLAIALASERSQEFISRVMALDSFGQLRVARTARDRASDDRLNTERTEAKVQRLLRTCEDIVLAANLTKVATPEITKRYEQLIKLEAGTLSPAR